MLILLKKGLCSKKHCGIYLHVDDSVLVALMAKYSEHQLAVNLEKKENFGICTMDRLDVRKTTCKNALAVD